MINPLYVFLHIPKTAGSTFVNLLENNFQRDETLSLWTNAFAPYMDYKKGKGNHDDLKMIHGHFSYTQFEQIRCFIHRPKIYFTFLREPTQRTISMFYHAAGKHSKDFKEWLTETHAEHNTQRVNTMTHMLSGDNPVTEDSLRKAKENLITKMTFGITEKFDESLDRFCQEFSYIFKTLKYENRNINKDKPKQIPPSIYHLIWELNNYDNELYKFAEWLFMGVKNG